MANELASPLPEPGSLQIGRAPYSHGPPGIVALTLTFVIAAAFATLSGVILFGWAAVRVLAISIAVSLMVESAFNLLARRTRSWSESYALLTGILLACTLPPTVSWQVVVVGAAMAIIVGQVLLGGIGNYVWQPVALARVFLQIMFHDQLTPASWPVLARGHLFWGDVTRSLRLPDLWTWSTHEVPHALNAWNVIPPVTHLRSPIPAGPDVSPAHAIATLVRDTLAPWYETLTGTAGGAIGEACAIAILIAGLLLMWRGILRWPMAVAAIASAAVLAALLPVRLHPDNAPPLSYWVPAAAVWDGTPVGLVYLCYHLTAGEFLFVVFLLAPDLSSSPLTSRGHIVFGLIIGTVTMLLRILVGIPAAAYWALLAANTLVPLINRLTQRPVLGTGR